MSGINKNNLRPYFLTNSAWPIMVGYLTAEIKLTVQNKSRGACHTGDDKAYDHW